MQNPLYAILVSPDQSVRDKILEGTKTITIRLGHRDYRPGPVMLCCNVKVWAVMADIKTVRHCLLREVTQQEWVDDGFPAADPQAWLEGMRQYYPDIEWGSPVTVVRWGNVQHPHADR